MWGDSLGWNYQRECGCPFHVYSSRLQSDGVYYGTVYRIRQVASHRPILMASWQLFGYGFRRCENDVAGHNGNSRRERKSAPLPLWPLNVGRVRVSIPSRSSPMHSG